MCQGEHHIEQLESSEGARLVAHGLKYVIHYKVFEEIVMILAQMYGTNLSKTWLSLPYSVAYAELR